MLKGTGSAKNVSVSVLEARVGRAIRPKNRLWAIIRLADRLADYEAAGNERALSLFAEAERLAEEVHDRRGLAEALRGAGRCHLNLSNIETALEMLQRALPIAEETGDSECEIIVLCDIGGIYAKQGHHELALATLERCTEIAELIGNRRIQASALNHTGALLKDLGRYEEAIKYYTKSLALLSVGTGWTRDQAIILIQMSYALRYIGKYSEALSAVEQASALCSTEQDPIKGSCQASRGQIYSEMGDYSNALESFFISAKILERIGDKLRLAHVYGNLMYIYRQLGNTREAIDFGEKALAVFEEIGHKRGQAEMFVELGEYYSDQGQRALAMRITKRCLALSKEIGSKNCETAALTTLAKLMIDQNKFPVAEELLQDALAIAEETHNRDRTVATLLGLGSLFLKRGNPNEAISPLGRAIEIAREIHSRRHEQEAHRMLAESLEITRAFKDALHHFKLASSIEKEIMGVEKQRAIAELQVRSDIEKLEQENTLWKKEAKRKSREIERMAMVIAEKTESIRSMKRRFKEIAKPWNSNERAEIDRLLLEFGEGHSAEGEKPIFHNEFQLVHRDILQKLSDHYPDLTFAQRKICILVREQLSTKQIADMLKVSTRTIDGHRYKIRKEMKLAKEVDLTTVLAAIV
jgi:tetratricopeptide (TPR) repeat protein/DNA-binding CsgD family transcriptional regulator